MPAWVQACATTARTLARAGRIPPTSAPGLGAPRFLLAPGSHATHRRRPPRQSVPRETRGPSSARRSSPAASAASRTTCLPQGRGLGWLGPTAPAAAAIPNRILESSCLRRTDVKPVRRRKLVGREQNARRLAIGAERLPSSEIGANAGAVRRNPYAHARVLASVCVRLCACVCVRVRTHVAAVVVVAV